VGPVHRRARKVAPASERELITLRAMLEASIALDETPALPTRASQAARPRPDTGERHRARELRDRPGWAWLRPFRRLDEYERALAELESVERELVEREPELV
jgi:hypothetical protein